MTDDRLKLGNCYKCGLPMSDNPHPEAGKPAHYLDVGCPRECIPCLVHSRHQWASRAMKAENEVRDLQAARATAEQKDTKPSTEQDWAKLDGAVAFHLIERHAEDWADAGAMMDAWRKAKSQQDAAIESKPAEQRDAWISVNDRLPAKSDIVLALFDSNDIRIAEYQTFPFPRWMNQQSGKWKQGATHWMPLPVAPADAIESQRSGDGS